MFKKHLFTIFLIGLVSLGKAVAQTDSTHLTLNFTPIELVTEMDSLLYGEDYYEQLGLEFTISDSVTFNKVHIELKEAGTSIDLFRRVYLLSDLEAASLIEEWAVSIPFGNLDNRKSYTASVIIENYAGALGTTIKKTINP